MAFLAVPIDLQSFIACGALFHTLAASLMKVFDCVNDVPFITRSGLYTLFKPGRFITSSLFVHLIG